MTNGGKMQQFENLFYQGKNGGYYPLKVVESEITTNEPISKVFIEQENLRLEIKGNKSNYDYFDSLIQNEIKLGFVSPDRWEKDAIMSFTKSGKKHAIPCKAWVNYDNWNIIDAGIDLIDPTSETIKLVQSVQNVSLEYK